MSITAEEYQRNKQLGIAKKLDKAGRTWTPATTIPYRNAELFCENCGESVGIHDIVCTDFRTLMYCSNCAKSFSNPIPYELTKDVKVVFDNGVIVDVEYTGGYYDIIRVNKICYYNKRGRFIKIKGKQCYLNHYNPCMK